MAFDSNATGAYYSFVFFSEENSYSGLYFSWIPMLSFLFLTYYSNVAQTFPLFSVPNNCTEKNIIISYLDGFLIPLPTFAADCSSTFTFTFYNSTENTIVQNYNLPSLDDIDLLVAGDNGDLWAATHSDTYVYYLPSGNSQWILVDLSNFGTFTVYAMTWDDGPDNLLVYGSSSTMGNQLLEIEPIALPPVIKLKSPGDLFIPGTIFALAVMDDPDDDDFGISFFLSLLFEFFLTIFFF